MSGTCVAFLVCLKSDADVELLALICVKKQVKRCEELETGKGMTVLCVLLSGQSHGSYNVLCRPGLTAFFL